MSVISTYQNSFLNNATFESGALAVVNLGGDSDTNGAIYGQLAGAYYGIDSIPEEWKKILHLESEISTSSIPDSPTRLLTTYHPLN